MPTQLNLFPVRVPIGAVTDGTGRRYDVLMTPEFARALSDLFTRVGGTNNLSTDELAALFESNPAPDALVAALQGTVLNLANQLAAATAENARLAALENKVTDLAKLLESKPMPNARLAALEQKLDDVAKLASLAGPVPTDWEHPGKIGAATRNSGAFATVGINAGLVNKPALYFGTDTTTGFYRIGVNNLGLAIAGAKLVDYSAGLFAITGTLNTTLGAALGNGTAATNVIVNGTAAGVAGGATFIVRNAGGTVLAFGNRSALLGGAYDATPYIYHVGTLTIHASAYVGGELRINGAFGCNGKVAQGANALGAAATDPASTQTLANNIRAALIACGIGS